MSHIMNNQEILAINKGLEEEKFRVFYIGLNEGVMKSFIANLHIEHHWLGLNYFFNKEYGWKPNYKPNSKTAKEARFKGSIFKTMYEMCKESYLNQNLINYDIRWNDGFQWFGRCCRDFTAHLLIDDYERSKKNANKRTIISELKRELSILKSLEIPSKGGLCLNDYNPYIKYGDQLIGLITLIEVSYSLAAIKPNFNKLYWQPFLKAIDEYIKFLESDMTPHKYAMDSTSEFSDNVADIKDTTRPQKGGKNKVRTIKVTL